MTPAKFIALAASDLDDSPCSLTWGPWRLSGHRLIDTEHHYAIDLTSCTSSAEVLDWLCQIADKSWATPELLGHLTQAINTILRPQGRLCSNGEDQRLISAQVRSVVRQYRQTATGRSRR
jgi:hypothetical protein